MSEGFEFPSDEVPRSDRSADEGHLKLLVGQNAEYFRTQWSEILRGNSRRCGFNKAAFFLAGLWIAYRKMYGLALMLWVLISLETVISDIVFVEVFGREESPAVYDRLVTFLIALCCGAFGNRLYLRHCCRKLEQVRRLGHGDGETVDDLLRNMGGTSIVGSIFVTLLGFGIAFGIWFIYALVMDAINGV